MNEPKKLGKNSQLPEDMNLTMSIKKISLPTTVDDFEETGRLNEKTALLICRDSDAKKWGPRWLKQAGMKAIVMPNPNLALTNAINIRPDVIIVEGGLSDSHGNSLFTTIQNSEEVAAPLIVLCSGTKELFAALAAGVFDVVRKPLEWQVISLRAKHAANIGGMESELGAARSSVVEAVEVAELARKRLRSHETIEPVTGLPNKTKFIDLLKRGMSAVERDEMVLAVMVVGFKRFSLVVEAMGQDSADLVMNEIGERINECLRMAEPAQEMLDGLRTAAAASIEIAKFALMFTTSGNEDAIRALQQKIVEKLSHPVQISGQTIHLSACVGVALYPQDANDVDELLQRADNAMRDAQSRGGEFQFYCGQTDAAAVRKLKLENMLHEALLSDGISVAYQPIANTSDGHISGVEALLRWQQPDQTFISPDEFVPIAEDSGLIIRIGDFLMDEACQQFVAWQDANVPLEHLCINVSKVQLVSGKFVQKVADLLSRYNIEPCQIELELSERGVLSGQFDLISQLHDLKQLGVRLSIDDFGTGDSSIAYLRELPVDVLKIDRSYISGLTQNEKDAAMISAMIAFSQKLDLRVIAEGVETEDQVQILQKLGCDQYQGFYTSSAVRGSEIADLVKKHAVK